MSRENTIYTVKLLSTVGLGLVASFVALLPLQTIPNIHHANTPSTAGRALKIPRRRQVVAVSTSFMAGAALSLTYYFSPPRGKHPYLLYAAVLSIGIAVQGSFSIFPRIDDIARHAAEFNGETMSKELEQLQSSAWTACAISITAFTTSLIGNAGDTY